MRRVSTATVVAVHLVRTAVVSAKSAAQREEQERVEELKTAPSRRGILDILPEGYGFLRTAGYLPGPGDVYVSLSHVRKHNLRKGDTVSGKVREARNNEKYPALLQVEAVNDMDPEKAMGRPVFDKLTPAVPERAFPARERAARDHGAHRRHGRSHRQGAARHGRVASRRPGRRPSSSRSRTASSTRTRRRTSSSCSSTSDRKRSRTGSGRFRQPRSSTPPSTSRPTSTSR